MALKAQSLITGEKFESSNPLIKEVVEQTNPKLTPSELANKQVKLEWEALIKKTKILKNYCKYKTLKMRGKQRK